MLKNSYRRRSFSRWDPAALFVVVAVVALVAAVATVAAAACALLHVVSTSPGRTAPIQGSGILAGLADLPAGFAPNEGQAAAGVRFVAHEGTGTILLLQSQTVFLPDPAPGNRDFDPGHTGSASAHAQAEPLVMEYVGANPDARLEAQSLLPGKANYLLGNRSASWRTGLPTFAQVAYRSLYPGIDLRYEAAGGQLRSSYVLSPGADPRAIRMRFAGASRSIAPTIDKTGGLHVASQTSLTAKAPVAWQEIGYIRVPISMGYVASGDGTVGLLAGIYDRTKPLYLSTALAYSTYLGGSGRDEASLIAVDSSGSAFITGLTASTDYPLANPLQPDYATDTDVFISKLNPSGTALDYSTYLGGSGHEEAWGIAVDSADSAYLAGFTSSTDFPTARAYQPSNGGGIDAFVSKLSPSGSSLVYSTYLGGTRDDHGWGMALSGDTAYVAGDTASADFPTSGALQPSYRGDGDAFIARLTSSGSALLFSTYLGGTGQDVVLGVATDGAGNAYVTGGTNSTDLNIPADNVYLPFNRGGEDAFVGKISGDGARLLYCTYLGGSGTDLGWALAVSSSGQAVVTGGTSSSDFPTRHAVQATKNLNTDSFVTELSSSGSWPIYSTYLGGNGDYDAGYGAAVDSAGDSYVSGITDSTDFPTANAVQPHNGGQVDAYLSEISPGGRALLFSTYLGGSQADWAWGMAIDSRGNIYTTGTARSPDFPTANPLQPHSAGDDDNIVVKVAAPVVPTPTSPPCDTAFTDVPPGSTFYPYIHCLACDGVAEGYDDHTFRPNRTITRGELAKIASNAAGYSDPMSGQMFQDVPPSNPFATYIVRLARRSVVAGYRCGRPAEPCVPPNNEPYFDPYATVTRSQATKIVAATAALDAPVPGAQTFQDVPPSHPFYRWIEPMGSAGLVEGYPCGQQGEPCIPPLSRPYFRPTATLTRGQASKIVANTFYADCVQSQLTGPNSEK